MARTRESKPRRKRGARKPAATTITRRAGRRREAQIGFEALSIEGGLLSPEWLARAAQLQAGKQGDADYRVPKGLSLRDEIGRYWRIAQALWHELETGRTSGGDPRALSERFVTGLLRESFGFASVRPVEPAVAEGRTYPIGFSALDGRVPVVVAPTATGLDALSPAFGDGSRRRSAFGLAQEYLNAEGAALWGIASDGHVLRILRDNSSLTRPAWIQADLARIFGEERYPDFAALWLLAHETRFGRPDQPVTECALESWRTAGREEGTRAREHLRDGVEEALLALGQGFLVNATIRSSLQDGSLTTKDYFNQLLRLVYRLIFLLTVEERELLHPSSADEKARALYAAGYSLKLLRDRSLKRSAHDRHIDRWEAVKIVFRGLATGEPRLRLPALAGLFASTECPALDAAKLENRALLLAVFKLSWLRDDGGVVRVNWRDMGPEELGSVYESLLELVPQITEEGRRFAFATGGATKGHARKTTGSYYTPDSLVHVLLDSALEPVIADTIARNPAKTIDALLALSIVDPACGSGHFLLAAARRLAAHVARVQADGTPSGAEYRHALRQVVSRCIYGVDLNPMAVELCKVSLWMEAVDPGLPLTFLDSHIQHGNALLGTTPELMANGIPDDAWKPIEGDDKKIASALKKRNKLAARIEHGLESLWSQTSDAEANTVARALAELESATDTNADALAAKERRWDDILASPEYRHQKLIANAWCAAFVWPKPPGALADAAPTNDLWRQLRDAQGEPPALLVNTTRELAEQYQFFHWHLQFPQVFAKGGFDVVLGNPPWERVKLQEQEFFASRSEEIATSANATQRKTLIANLPTRDPQLWAEWCAASRRAEGESQLIRQSGRFPLCGKGDVNTYAVFAEHNGSALGQHGRAGFIVPTGIATDETTKDYFRMLVGEERLVSLYDFRNHDGLFYDVGHRRFRFCLLTVAGGACERPADLVFFAESAEHVRDTTRRFSLAPEDFATLNPNTRTCPTFRSRRDADINLPMYRRTGILWREDDTPDGNPWGLTIRRHLDMNKPDALSRCSQAPTDDAVIVYEAKMVHQFDHRSGDYADRPEGSRDTQLPDVPNDRLIDPQYRPRPRYWIDGQAAFEPLRERWRCRWILCWRDISRSTDERTAIAAVLPHSASDFTLRIASLSEPPDAICLASVMNSFVFDYAVRQKNGGTHLSDYITRQCPVPRRASFDTSRSWSSTGTLRDWLLPRVLELTYTAWDLEPFARDVGYGGPPFRWDPERRFLLRSELDAAFFHLYGLSRDDTDYVMDSFPIVKKNDEKAHGEYRTKRVILEIYDAMTESAHTGTSYETRLDPPPADPRVAHARRATPRTIGPMPEVIPRVPSEEEAAILLWAILHASGGTMRRSDLARAFALRSEPALLATLAPATLKGTAQTWASKVGKRTVVPGLFVATLRALSERGGVELSTDDASRSLVRLTSTSAREDQIDPWYRFEAQLVYLALIALAAADRRTLDSAITDVDRTLLELVS